MSSPGKTVPGLRLSSALPRLHRRQGQRRQARDQQERFPGPGDQYRGERLLGPRMTLNEGVKFCMSVLTELQDCGVKDVFIVGVDGLSGFHDTSKAVFPETKVQLCVVHRIRNSLKYVLYKDRKTDTRDLKASIAR